MRSIARRLAVTLAVTLAAAVALTGCANTTPTAQEPTATSSAPEPTATSDAPTEEADPYQLTEAETDARFVKLLIEAAPEFADVPRRLILRAGHNQCHALDNGVTAVEVRDLTIGGGFTRSTADTLIGLSVAAYCPQHEDALDDVDATP